MIKMLFICIGNTCRSPMAEAMARQLGRGEIDAYSAGLMPTGRVARGSLDTLSAMGYASDGLASKGLEDVPLHDMDVIVSLIGDDGLRYLPTQLGADLESWSIRDPYGEDEEVYLAAAKIIERKVTSLIERELSPG